jgi:DNA invertase Pin-like site-specific DNA recombinase
MTSKTKAQKAKMQLAIKRAAIYIRVSSERQAEADKISPQAQEADCRAYCATRGYTVVEVYRDTEKYRVGGRMVEPRGTRVDRPQLQRMLADARAGRFEMIIAWREDRLYRSYRPMLEVLECLEQTGVDIELVKETFDRKLAPVKAWAARMELDAKHDRFMMGVAGRFAKGKAWNGIPPYGYHRVDDYLEFDPVESKWVRQIFRWYADSLGVREIRRQLIAAGAPQKAQGTKLKAIWNPNIIYKILRRDFYYTGRMAVAWDGQTFEIPVPPIVDAETAKKVAKRFAQHKVHPAVHVKHDYLAMGFLYCGVCNVKMTSQTRVRRHGKELKTPKSEYRCERWHLGFSEPDCPHRMNTKKLDAELWAKVWALFEDPGEFERRIEEKIAVLQATEGDAKVDCEKLEQQQEDLLMERQKVITQWRKGKMTDKDYDLQIAALTIEETELERELNEKRLLVGNKAERLIEAARLYREKVVEGAECLNDKPITPEHARLQFQTRRKFVERLVTRIALQADKTVKVDTEINLAEAAENGGMAQISHPSTRRRYPPAHTG